MNEQTKLILEIIATAVAILAGIIGIIVKLKKGKKGTSKKQSSSTSNAEANAFISINTDEQNHKEKSQKQPSPTSDAKANAVISVNINEKNRTSGRKDTPEAGVAQITQIRLADVYTSVFAENGQLKTETIYLDYSEGSNVTGKVELAEKGKDGKETREIVYTFKGTFNNRILTGEYYSESQNDDERGAINLKLINKDILSGFCSFSKSSASEDEIRMSPYVWVSGKDHDLINGSYEFCAECHRGGPDCCCASDDVDMPILLHNEALIIQSSVKNRSKKKMSYFSTALNDTTVRQVKREKSDGDGVSHCHFYNYTEKICRIYENRPIDCRLFPFDIVLNKTIGEYEVGYYSDLCNRELPDYQRMCEIAHILRPYFFLMLPYLNITTADYVCEKLKTAEFARIALLKDFVL